MFISNAQQWATPGLADVQRNQILKSRIFKGRILKGLRIQEIKALFFSRTVNYPLDPASLICPSRRTKVYLPI